MEPILIVPDCHIPYEDQRAWKLMMKVGKALRPKHLIIIGDFLDFYSISSHSKDPRRAGQLEDELTKGRERLDELDTLRAKHKVFVAGNHEDRLRRYLEEKAPELLDSVSVKRELELSKRRYQYVPYKRHTKLGKLYLTHDVGTSGRNSVYTALDTFEHSVVTGHAHRIAYTVGGNAIGEYRLSAQFGWLGDHAAIDYMANAKVNKDWTLGFGVGYLDSRTGLVYMTPIPIVRYTCCFNGKLFKA